MGRKEEFPSRGNFDGMGLLMELKNETAIAVIRALCPGPGRFSGSL